MLYFNCVVDFKMVVFISLLGRSVDLLANLRSRNTELIFGQGKYFFLPEKVTYEISYTIVLASLVNFFFESFSFIYRSTVAGMGMHQILELNYKMGKGKTV